MGDQRFVATYSRVRQSGDVLREIRELPDESVIEALAGASRQQDPYLANVLATEALNRVRRTAAVLENLADGVVAIDPAGVITYANAAATSLLASGALEGRALASVLGPFADDVRRVAKTGDVLRLDRAWFRRSDGGGLRAALVAAPIVQDGDATGIVLAFRDVAAEERAARALARENALLAALADTTRALLESLDPEETLHTILRRAADLAGTRNGYVYVLERDGTTLRVSVAEGAFVPFVGFRLQLGEGLAGRAVAEGRTQVVDDYDEWSGRSAGIPRGVLHAAVAVPLRARDAREPPVGAIALAHSDPTRRFSPSEIAILERFAELAALALANARHVAALKAA